MAKKMASTRKRVVKRPKQAGPDAESQRRGRPNLPFPGVTFESVVLVGKAIWDYAGASREIKRETLFVEILNKAPESGHSRNLVRNSSRYGLTVGSEKSDTLKLTDKAVLLFEPSTAEHVRIQTKVDLALNSVNVFRHLYETFQGGNLPAPAVMMDTLDSVPKEERQRCVDIFIGNAKYAGVIVIRSGAEYLARPAEISSAPLLSGQTSLDVAGMRSASASGSVDFNKICFVVTPIGEEGEPQRKHADMMLSLIERALEPLKIEVIRADKITSPGMISKQIVEYVHKSRLVVADLSFGNQNVFYERCLRHLMGLPIVHVIRKRDPLPFDVLNFRTVMVDDEDMYDLIAKLDTYRADIANHAREALDAGESTDNPILSFFPGLRVKPS